MCSNDGGKTSPTAATQSSDGGSARSAKTEEVVGEKEAPAKVVEANYTEYREAICVVASAMKVRQNKVVALVLHLINYLRLLMIIIVIKIEL